MIRIVATCASSLALIASMVATSPAEAQWKQDQFAIASWYDLRWSGNPYPTQNQDIGDLGRLQQFADAGFNLLTGTQPDALTYTFTGMGTKYNSHAVSNQYVLSTVATFNKIPGHPEVRAFVIDHRFASNNTNPIARAPTAVEMADYTGLTGDLANALYGYKIFDEPGDLTIAQGQGQKIAAMQNLDPNRPVLVNLSNSAVIHDYRPYVRAITNNARLFSFDFYPIVSWDGKNELIPISYFASYKVVAEESRRARIPFWGIGLSVPHKRTGAHPVGLLDVATSYRALDARIRFSAWVPIIYGAKGLMWYTYDTPCNDLHDSPTLIPSPGVCIATSGHFRYDDALLDYDGNPTHGGIYDIVSTINHEISTIGPTLMDLDWLQTIHGDTVNNLPEWERDLPTADDRPALIQSRFGDQGDFEVVVANTPALAAPGILPSSRDPADFAVGIMRGRHDGLPHLLVLNKDVYGGASRTVTLGLRQAAVPLLQDKVTGLWAPISSQTKAFSLTIAPGDMQVVRLDRGDPQGGKLCHYWRDNDDLVAPVFEWHESQCFQEHLGSAPALIQSDFGEQGQNFELVVEDSGSLCHYWRDDVQPFGWHKSECFGNEVASAPALIQSNLGRMGRNFEVVVREARPGDAAGDQLCHYWRDNDQQPFEWHKSECFGEHVASAPALIQDNFGSRNFEVVVREVDTVRVDPVTLEPCSPDDEECIGRFRDRICHYWRDNNPRVSPLYVWHKSGCFAEHIDLRPRAYFSAPALIESKLGQLGRNFEVVVREGNQLCHYWRDNDQQPFEWHKSECFGENVASAPALIQSNFGGLRRNFEVLVQEDGRVCHYWRDNDAQPFTWEEGECFDQ